MDTADWTVRPYAPGDEQELIQLHERVFGRPITEDHWRWKLRQRPTPVDTVWLAVDQERPIFQYAGIPTPVSLPDGVVPAMVSVDTMTDPGYRRRGLLTNVGQQMYDYWLEEGIAFVLGLPNEQWGSRATALGWVSLFRLEWLVYRIQPTALLTRRARLPWPRRVGFLDAIWNRYWSWRPPGNVQVVCRQVSEAELAFDRLWELHGDQAGISVVRDAAWINWRYLECPSQEYRVLLAERSNVPAGYLTYRVEWGGETAIAYIADLFTPGDDPAITFALLQHLRQELERQEVSLMTALAAPGSEIHRRLKQAGFFRRWQPFILQYVPLNTELPLPDISNPANWTVAGGDFDVV